LCRQIKCVTQWKKSGQLQEKKISRENLELKVLVVDHNQFSVIPIKETFDKRGILYDIAKNGLMAVDRYENTMKEGYFYNFLIN